MLIEAIIELFRSQNVEFYVLSDDKYYDDGVLEDHITKVYLLQIQDKVLKIFDIFEIVSFLESSKLEGQDYVFDLRVRSWIKVCEIQVLRDTGFVFKASIEKEIPSFIPPHKLPSESLEESVDSDYLYLLKFYEELKQSSIDHVESVRRTHEIELLNIKKENSSLQSGVSELNVLVFELEKSKEQQELLNSNLEEVVGEFKADAFLSSKKLNLAEEELLQAKVHLETEKEKIYHELEEFKNTNTKSFESIVLTEKENFELVQKNQSLSYALKVQEQKYHDMKLIFTQYEDHSKKEGLNERVLEKAFDYFLHGPVGGDQAKLEKKVDLLEKELKEKDLFFEGKLKRSSDELSEVSSHFKKKNKEIELHYKKNISELLNEKEILVKKVDELDSYHAHVQKNQSLIDSQSSKENEKHTLQISFQEAKLEKATTRIAFLESELSKVMNENQGQVEVIDNFEKALKVKKSEENKVRSQELDHSEKIKQLENSNKDLLEKNTKIEELIKANQLLLDKNSKVETRKSEYKAEYTKLLAKSEKSLAKIKALENQKSDVVVDDDSQEELEKLKQEIEGYTNRLQNEQDKTLQLKIDLEKLKEADTKIELVKASGQDEEELSRLIGDSFEVVNDSVWIIQGDDGKKSGPHSFSTVYDMKEAGELTKESRVKKQGEAFKPCKDIFELSVPVTTHGEGENRRFFVKRNSVRVPFYELVTFEIGGEEYRGYCTSLSSGGVFIEMTKIDEEVFKMNGKGRVLFPSGALESPFNCIAQIKNVSVEKPKGIGLMFVDLPDEAKEDILSYVNNCLNKNKKSA
ncbi:hypothetical protein A9Q84_02300 [Halobacteriovorax marinus]|uniref:PilZ domain-containing protein n=1 Tax=Halobacteriovorax marinus TaxID=97084 RepID=A0A1Y5FCF3_9BACT|nr:hypothetical protein A9Q84_02300 [Halobacteriovorax marinus]